MKDPNSAILLVERNQEDLFLLERSLRRAGVANPIQITRSEEETCRYLERTGLCRNRFRSPPALILLDLSLEGDSAFRLLHWIRSQRLFQSLPVVAMGNSTRPADIERAYAFGANAYFAKRIDLDELIDVLHQLEFLAPLAENRQFNSPKCLAPCSKDH